MSNQGYMNSQQPEYTLPGIIHYLQREKTRIDRDRINWESEKGELKARISKLEAENQELKEKLELSEATVAKSGKNTPKSKKAFEQNFHDVDLNPLARSKEKLQSQLKQISHLLSNSSIDNIGHLELGKDRSFFSTTSPLHDNASTADSSLNSQVPSVKIDIPSNDSSHTPKQADSSKGIVSDAPITPSSTSSITQDFDPETRDVESDAETVTDDIGEEEDSHVNDKFHHKNTEKFLLSGHIGTALSLAVNSKGDILAGADDGTIKLWEFNKILTGDGEVKPTMTYRGDQTPIKQIKWIDDEYFVTSSKEHVKFWSKKVGVSKRSMKCSADFFDIKKKTLLISTNGHLSLNSVVFEAGSIAYKRVPFRPESQLEYDHAQLSSDASSILLCHENQFESISISNGQSQNPVLRELKVDHTTDKITSFVLSDKYFLLTVNHRRAVIYNLDDKKTIFNQSYKDDIVNIDINNKNTLVALDNGEVKAYQSGKTDKVLVEQNLFSLFPDHAPLKHEDLETLRGGLKASQLLAADYIIGACEDGTVRGFKI